MDGKQEGRIVISGDKVCECVWRGWGETGDKVEKRREGQGGGEGFHPEKDECSDTGREEVEEY